MKKIDSPFSRLSSVVEQCILAACGNLCISYLHHSENILQWTWWYGRWLVDPWKRNYQGWAGTPGMSSCLRHHREEEGYGAQHTGDSPWKMRLEGLDFELGSWYPLNWSGGKLEIQSWSSGCRCGNPVRTPVGHGKLPSKLSYSSFCHSEPHRNCVISIIG